MPQLQFECRQQSRIENRQVEINQVIIAGWTGRDSNSVQKHVEELKALGIPPPSAVPTFYRVSAELVWDEVRNHADSMLLKSWISDRGDRVAYQQGSLAEILPLDTLLEQMRVQMGSGLEPGTMLFCGTLPTTGGVRPSARFSGLILDPSAGRTITLDYAIDFLRIVS